MGKENKTQENNDRVTDFISLLERADVRSDCSKLIEMMSKVSLHEPKMWGSAIIGFDKYHYIYESGREGDAPILGFSPRKGKLSVYIDPAVMGSGLFNQLGKHTTSKVCIYIKRLSDVDATVLSQILKQSYDYTKSFNRTA